MGKVINMIQKVFKPFFLLKLSSSIGIQLVSLFLIYLLTPEEYGQLALIITVAQLLYIISTGWTEPTIVNLGTREYSEKGSYLNILVYRTLIVLACFILVSVVFIIFKSCIVSFIHDAKYYWITYFLFITYALQSFFSQLLYPCRKNVIQAAFDIIYVLFLVFIVFMWVKDISAYVYANLMLNGAYAILISILFYKYFHKDCVCFSKKEFSKTFKFSVWQILGVIGIYLTNLGVNYVLSMESIAVRDIGLYNVAYKLFSEFTPIFAICAIVIPQWVYGTQDKKLLLKDIKRKTYIGVVALSVAYLSIYFILNPFLAFIGKDDYQKSVVYYISLLPAFIFMSYSQIMQLVIMTTPAFKHIQYATLIQGVILLLSCFVFVYVWGIFGAIIAVTIAFIGKAVYLKSIYELKAKDLILTNKNYE